MAKPKSATSPLAPARFPDLPAIEGVALATAQAGVRYAGRTDVLAVTMRPGVAAAGVFTTSKAPSAPVDWCRVNLEKARATEDGPVGRVLIVNSGNANAFTGKAGAAAAKDTAAAAARAVGCRQRDVFLASTGVIGEVLPADRIVAVIDDLVDRAQPGHWEDAARAIMTTDTFPKGATRTATIDGEEVRIVGIAKGAGMIQPDMATMLSFIFTDAAIPAEPLQAMLSIAVRDSFNAITVDSDTSTSDTVLAFATGAVAPERPVRRVGDPRLKAFRAALQDLMTDLAQQVVRDGEGATKFVTVKVTGAQSPLAARRIAFAIANSPLVKTAIAGEDPNWGRIVMAIGKAGEAADRDGLSIRIGGIEVAVDGAVAPGYREADGAAVMKRQEILIEVDVAVGDGESTVWTCDLGHDYIAINADYRS